jgi:ribose transport system permease protein
MTDLALPRPRPSWSAPLTRASTWRALLPFLSLVAILVPIFLINPRTMSYFGLNLMLGLAIPIMFATLAQMCMLTVNDLDLGIGAYVGFVTCVAATWLVNEPLLGIAVLAGGVLAYGAAGALIHWRNVPSLVVTLGMSFVWLGLAILVLPSPGGARLAGVFGLLAGLSLLGLSTSGDSNIAQRYTLLSIAGAILGGCDFVGGRVSPVGAVVGALVLTLAGSLLTFLRISPDWQIGAQGAILIIVLALRALTSRRRR